MMTNSVYCPVCGHSLTVRLAQGRKSGKPFIMLLCPEDGRHLRAFITHQPYVAEVMGNLESQQKGVPKGTP